MSSNTSMMMFRIERAMSAAKSVDDTDGRMRVESCLRNCVQDATREVSRTQFVNRLSDLVRNYVHLVSWSKHFAFGSCDRSHVAATGWQPKRLMRLYMTAYVTTTPSKVHTSILNQRWGDKRRYRKSIDIFENARLSEYTMVPARVIYALVSKH
jgi:hypothetical protein